MSDSFREEIPIIPQQNINRLPSSALLATGSIYHLTRPNLGLFSNRENFFSSSQKSFINRSLSPIIKPFILKSNINNDENIIDIQSTIKLQNSTLDVIKENIEELNKNQDLIKRDINRSVFLLLSLNSRIEKNNQTILKNIEERIAQQSNNIAGIPFGSFLGLGGALAAGGGLVASRLLMPRASSVPPTVIPPSFSQPPAATSPIRPPIVPQAVPQAAPPITSQTTPQLNPPTVPPRPQPISPIPQIAPVPQVRPAQSVPQIPRVPPASQTTPPSRIRLFGLLGGLVNAFSIGGAIFEHTTDSDIRQETNDRIQRSQELLENGMRDLIQYVSTCIATNSRNYRRFNQQSAFRILEALRYLQRSIEDGLDKETLTQTANATLARVRRSSSFTREQKNEIENRLVTISRNGELFEINSTGRVPHQDDLLLETENPATIVPRDSSLSPQNLSPQAQRFLSAGPQRGTTILPDSRQPSAMGDLQELERTSLAPDSPSRRIFQTIFPSLRRQNTSAIDPNEVPGEVLGGLARRYESGRLGSAAIGRDSTGGWSYGSYQIATRTGTMQRFLSFLQNSNPELYARLQAAGGVQGAMEGTQDFQNAWRELSQNSDFDREQHAFIRRTHYDPLANRLRELGLDLNQRSASLREVIWSTGVQHGGGTNVVERAIQRIGRPITEISDAELIEGIYEERRTRFGSSTPAVQASVQRRFTEEQARALTMLRNEQRQTLAATPVEERNEPRRLEPSISPTTGIRLSEQSISREIAQIQRAQSSSEQRVETQENILQPIQTSMSQNRFDGLLDTENVHPAPTLMSEFTATGAQPAIVRRPQEMGMGLHHWGAPPIV